MLTVIYSSQDFGRFIWCCTKIFVSLPPITYCSTLISHAMSKYINPFTDVGFKKIFGQEINKDLLIDFLNSLLKGERVINNVTFLDKEQVGEFKDDRSLTYIVCRYEPIYVSFQN